MPLGLDMSFYYDEIDSRFGAQYDMKMIESCLPDWFMPGQTYRCLNPIPNPRVSYES